MRAREPAARYAVLRQVMVDSSVLIDVLDPDPVWFEWSSKRLAPLIDEGVLVINRSALEWILDQYKETKPKDPTIREKSDTYRFADYKEKVIDLSIA